MASRLGRRPALAKNLALPRSCFLVLPVARALAAAEAARPAAALRFSDSERRALEDRRLDRVFLAAAAAAGEDEEEEEDPKIFLIIAALAVSMRSRKARTGFIEAIYFRYRIF